MFPNRITQEAAQKAARLDGQPSACLRPDATRSSGPTLVALKRIKCLAHIMIPTSQSSWPVPVFAATNYIVAIGHRCGEQAPANTLTGYHFSSRPLAYVCFLVSASRYVACSAIGSPPSEVKPRRSTTRRPTTFTWCRRRRRCADSPVYVRVLWSHTQRQSSARYEVWPTLPLANRTDRTATSARDLDMPILAIAVRPVGRLAGWPAIRSRPTVCKADARSIEGACLLSQARTFCLCGRASTARPVGESGAHASFVFVCGSRLLCFFGVPQAGGCGDGPARSRRS
jgi:hypothetical protein